MKSTFQLFCCAALILGTSGCGNSNHIALLHETRTEKLEYDCSNFQPKAETRTDMQILLTATRTAVQHAESNQNLVAKQTMLKAYTGALENNDWRTLERVVVEYRCKHRNDFPK